MGDTLSPSTERLLVSIRQELSEIRREARGPSVPPTSAPSAPNVVKKITKTGHGWDIGLTITTTDNGTTWDLTDASDMGNVNRDSLVGVIGRIIDADNFLAVFNGAMCLDLSTDYVVYYLDGTNPGFITATKPTTTIAYPVLMSLGDGLVWVYKSDGSPNLFAELDDVKLTALADQDIFVWDAASGKVINTPLPSSGAVYLDDLLDVTLSLPVANQDFLRNNGTAWVNESLGPIKFTLAENSLLLDGGAVTGTAMIVGIGKTGSRFVYAANTALDFLLTGTLPLLNDICARIISATTTSVIFCDQAGTGTGNGDTVINWTCSSAPASRKWTIGLAMLFKDPASTATDYGIKMSYGTGSGDAGFTFSDYGGTHKLLSMGYNTSIFGVAVVQIHTDLDFGSSGLGIYANRNAGTSSNRITIGTFNGIWHQSGTTTIDAAGSVAITGATAIDLTGASDGSFVVSGNLHLTANALFLSGAGTVNIGSASTTLTFFSQGIVGATRQTVSSPTIVVTTGTAGGTYTSTEQLMLINLKSDVTNLRTWAAALSVALKLYNLIA